VVGPIELSRASMECMACREAGCPLDERLGVEGSASRGAERLMCLASADSSFETASSRLEELLGWTRCGNTLRTTCYRHALEMERFRESDPEAVKTFRNETGDVEFETDGTCVNTTEGWKEMRLGIFCKRRRGAPAEPEAWDARALPKPHARCAFAAMESSARFGRRWRPWARRLGILDPSLLTTLGDGAKWIWEQQVQRLRGSAGVLDVYHVFEHVAAAGKSLFGEGTAAAEEWIDRSKQLLLSEGFRGLEQHTDATHRQLRSPKKRRRLQKLRNYLVPHADHLHYRERLAQGRTIGSGLIEGGCKHLIGRRLKQTGARWRRRNLNKMGTLCCTAYSDHWKPYWDQPAHIP
jgi:hypothetical protein